MGFFDIFSGKKNKVLQEVLAQGATVIDVRTKDEFNYGHVDGSLNIPLDQIQHKLARIKKIKTPIVLCCASGMRSANATSLLQQNNIGEVYNGGSWSKVNRLMSK